MQGNSVEVSDPDNWLYVHAHVADGFTGQSVDAIEIFLSGGFSRLRFFRKPPHKVVACVGFDQGLDENFLACGQSPFKIAVIWEPRQINKSVFEFVETHITSLFHVLSHDDQFLSRHPSRASFFYTGGSYIRPRETLSAWPKSRLVSISASKKRFLPGHDLRHRVVQDIRKTRLAKMGTGYRPYASAGKPYKNFMFSVVIENVQEARFFTEKLVHCLLYRCVPVYWGALSLPESIDERGVFRFNSIEELEKILNDISVLSYQALADSIVSNQAAAWEYASGELNLQRAIAPLLSLENFESDSATQYFASPDAVLSGRSKFNPFPRASWI